MIDEEGRNCTVVADGRSDAAVPLCSERASDAHLTASVIFPRVFATFRVFLVSLVKKFRLVCRCESLVYCITAENFFLVWLHLSHMLVVHLLIFLCTRLIGQIPIPQISMITFC